MRNDKMETQTFSSQSESCKMEQSLCGRYKCIANTNTIANITFDLFYLSPSHAINLVNSFKFKTVSLKLMKNVYLFIKFISRSSFHRVTPSWFLNLNVQAHHCVSSLRLKLIMEWLIHENGTIKDFSTFKSHMSPERKAYSACVYLHL